MTLRVGFNGRLLSDPSLRGWNRYTVNLIAALLDQDVQIFLYLDHHGIHPDHLKRFSEASSRPVEIRIAPAMNYFLWEQRWLPRECIRDRLDLLHTTFHFGLPFWSGACRRILTLHDAIGHAPEAGQKSAAAPWKARLCEWIARVRAHHIITVSDYSRTELMRWLRIPERKLTVIAEAADPRFGRPVPEAEQQRVALRYELPARYFFYVGGWEARKNVPFLLRAFAEAQLDDATELILAGGRPPQQEQMRETARELGIGHRVKLLGWVEDGDLPALYAGALAFVYPSRAEGFGLQLCEAMAMGCPTLAARSSCLPEVLGQGGETFSLDSPAELAKLLARVASSESYRKELAERARWRSLDYSWQATAERTLGTYRQIIPTAAP